ncbi:hypothetical protein TSAR_013321 [Trichomalopsis sarcophagae]|uniref:Uncharacterized protein n=1 Tax=Trichomalopsis sarcophagae TaxID=543379 RepID=A0A232EMZ0_9HYME|nr:hypothetical protein TSAR_013321 [Trichomalopsis sarcophagae]
MNLVKMPTKATTIMTIAIPSRTRVQLRYTFQQSGAHLLTRL